MLVASLLIAANFDFSNANLERLLTLSTLVGCIKRQAVRLRSGTAPRRKKGDALIQVKAKYGTPLMGARRYRRESAPGKEKRN